MDREQLRKDILNLLSSDARITSDEVAKMLGVEPDTVREEIAYLEKEGIIVKYNTLVNWEKLDASRVDALIEVRLTLNNDTSFNAIADKIVHFPEVRSMYLLSGPYDLLVQVEGRSLREVAQFVNEQLSPIDGVLSTATHFILKKYKVEDVEMEPNQTDERLVVTP